MNKGRCASLIIGFILAANADAAIYRCISQEGGVIYQDTDCAKPHPDNRILPNILSQRSKNHPNQQGRTTSLAATRRQQAVKLKQTQGAKAKAQRQAAWRANRCEHAKSQKEDIKAVLRRGYRATTERHLKERLKKIEDRERRYCCQTTRND